jgi:hypothetical protein
LESWVFDYFSTVMARFNVNDIPAFSLLTHSWAFRATKPDFDSFIFRPKSRHCEATTAPRITSLPVSLRE